MTSVTTGMSYLSPVVAEDLQALLAHALVGIGAGARLERAAAEDVRAGRLDRAGDRVHPLGAFDGARAGDHAPDVRRRSSRLPTSTTLGSGWASRLASLYGGMIGMTCHAGNGRSGSACELGLVADDADDGAIRAAAQMGLQPKRFDPLDHVVDLLVGDARFEDMIMATGAFSGSAIITRRLAKRRGDATPQWAFPAEIEVSHELD